jgi:hypothetical protein
LLAPTLSVWSVNLDTPICIWRILVIEVASSVRQISIVNPDVVPGSLPITPLSVPFRSFASLYREAVSSETPVYEYQCLYKVAEGVRKHQAQLIGELVERGGRATAIYASGSDSGRARSLPGMAQGIVS